MSKRTYAIVLEPQEEGGYTVSVPALPEVVTEGDTEVEAIAMAREAIELAIEHRLSKGMEIPSGTGSVVREIAIVAAA
jgi:antitoxin HicB